MWFSQLSIQQWKVVCCTEIINVLSWSIAKPSWRCLPRLKFVIKWSNKSSYPPCQDVSPSNVQSVWKPSLSHYKRPFHILGTLAAAVVCWSCYKSILQIFQAILSTFFSLFFCFFSFCSVTETKTHAVMTNPKGQYTDHWKLQWQIKGEI